MTMLRVSLVAETTSASLRQDRLYGRRCPRTLVSPDFFRSTLALDLYLIAQNQLRENETTMHGVGHRWPRRMSQGRWLCCSRITAEMDRTVCVQNWNDAQIELPE